jgi:putative two-component system response regulator
MITAEHADARILAVDDEPANLRLLEHLLASVGYRNVRVTHDARAVVPLVMEWDPDIVLLDLSMPHLDGFGVLELLGAVLPADSFLPVVVLTANPSIPVREHALAAGANDFLTKPFDHTDVLLRINNLLHTRALHTRLEDHNQLLEARVRQRTMELEEARAEILQRLAAAAEYRDDDTHQHTRRVGDVAAALAIEVGCTDADAEIIRGAAPLHDLGKIGISDDILLKPGRLTREEFTEIQRHTEIGARILAGSRSAILQMGELIARTHHERWNGTGYLGLRGEHIPLPSRIVGVADVFDALTHERPYKHAWPRDEAVAYVRDQSGAEFDPMVVRAFDALENEGRLDALLTSPGPRGADVSRLSRLASQAAC